MVSLIILRYDAIALSNDNALKTTDIIFYEDATKALEKIVTLWMLLFPDIYSCFHITADGRQVSAGGPINVVSLAIHTSVVCHSMLVGLSGSIWDWQAWTSTLSAREAWRWGHVHVVVPEAGVRPVSNTACLPSISDTYSHRWKRFRARLTGDIVREILLLVTEFSDCCHCPVYVSQLLTSPSHSLQRGHDIQEINAELRHMLPSYRFWHHCKGFNSALPDRVHVNNTSMSQYVSSIHVLISHAVCHLCQ